MTRARHTQHIDDGMAWLQVMPFPAMNPWNWWALAAPQNAALATLKGAQAAMHAWRCSADAMRTAMRAQQDAMLTMLAAPMLKTSVERAEPGADKPAAEQAPDDATQAAFVEPFAAATRAYSSVGKAFITAQRDTLRAFAGVERP
ncbi:MAG: hypothetical protein K2P58_15155 [Hyphomonadaceae bacterium]|nr:hypothetical protein [Hyphomonadaceae bacterium]